LTFFFQLLTQEPIGSRYRPLLDLISVVYSKKDAKGTSASAASPT
jgi:hypothetical protein